MVPEMLEKVNAVSKANVYWDGKVTSRTFFREDGSKFTLGIITAGSYTFDVGDREVVQLIAGDCEVLLPTESEWRRVETPNSFEIIANSKYQIRTTGVCEYLCDYYKD
jgi:uncharacterized protein YaiE (UPF0345 family)